MTTTTWAPTAARWWKLVGGVTQKDNAAGHRGAGRDQRGGWRGGAGQAMMAYATAGAKLLVLHTAAGRVGAMDVGA
jgi:NADH-quinone oxidoreductase subunit G